MKKRSACGGHFFCLLCIILYPVLVHELFKHVQVHRVSHVEEGLVVYRLLPSVNGHLLVYHVEAQVQVLGQALHAVDHAILVEEHIDELKAKDKRALWISDNIEKAKLAKTAAYEGCKRILAAFRDKGIDPRALAELLNRADEAEVLDIETTLN